MRMIRVSGIEGIANLASDCVSIAATVRVRGSAIVANNIEFGNKTAQTIADNLAGPHGANYSKRLSAEMKGLLEGEYGPSAVVGTRFTGVGGSAGAMRDLNKSASTTAPRFARQIGEMAEGLFWP